MGVTSALGDFLLDFLHHCGGDLGSDGGGAGADVDDYRVLGADGPLAVSSESVDDVHCHDAISGVLDYPDVGGAFVGAAGPADFDGLVLAFVPAVFGAFDELLGCFVVSQS